MRKQHIIGAALMAAFVIGCSTSSKQTPTVRFGSYVDAAGNRVVGKSSQATFELENPSASLITCAFHLHPGEPRDAIVSIQPYSTNRVLLLVGRTNAETLRVTMMR